MKTYLETEDIKIMEQTATYLRDKLLIRLLFRLGCRISEALALTVRDVDMAASQVTIIHLKQRNKFLCPSCEARLSRSSSFCPKCGIKIDEAKLQEQEHRKFRTIPIDTETLTILKYYVDQGGPVLKNGKKYLFGINRHRAWQIIRDCAQKTGLPSLINPDTGRTRGVSPHRLRDAFAVHAMKLDDSGDGLRLLQEHLGHASFDTTAKYRKIAGEEHREWYQKLWQEN
jgi:integrase/recombinase XerD